MTSDAQNVSPPVVLTIAGLDPSGGAGVIADVRTFAAFGCFATAAITSLTFQNTTGVFGVVHQSAATVLAQVTAIIEDLVLGGAKTGMLPTRDVIVEVARLFRENDLPAPIVDPVMRATSGDDLIDDVAVRYLVSDLFPVARLVTPNIPEAERLTGMRIVDETGMRTAAHAIRQMGARAVLVKGGHLARQVAGGSGQKSDSDSGRAQQAIDVLDNEGKVSVLSHEMISGGEVHGSGCTLSAAIAACLSRGMNLEEAVQAAKSFVSEAIRQSIKLGHGARPVYVGLKSSIQNQ